MLEWILKAKMDDGKKLRWKMGKDACFLTWISCVRGKIENPEVRGSKVEWSLEITSFRVGMNRYE